MSNSTFIGLTIGPVVKTLMMAERTRQLWAASYTFSYLMKEIARAFLENHKDRLWLQPGVGEAMEDVFKKAKDRKSLVLRTTGAGTFPDHMIFSSPDEADLDQIKNIGKEVIIDFARKVAKELAEKLGIMGEDASIETQLLQYFQIYIVRKRVPANENPILVLGDILNTIELQQQCPPIKTNYLLSFFDVVSDSFLTDDAFGEKHEFNSIPEIALTTHLLSTKANEKKQTCIDFIAPLKRAAEEDAKKSGKKKTDSDDRYHEWVNAFITDYNEKNKNDHIAFFTAHKYVAIVQVDGDNIGTLLKKVEQEKLPEFSKILTEFAAEAAELVNAYEGMPVYFGGDDALFFAPVVQGEKNIFQLLEALGDAFSAKFKVFEGVVPKLPTLSFGLSITFSKFPMYEAIQQARFLLFEVAKAGILSDEVEKEGGERIRFKNNLAFRVLRHSGSAFGGMIHLGKSQPFSVLESFRAIFEMNLKAPNDALRSIIYRLPENPVLFDLIGRDKEKLMQFLDNSFDEDIHKDLKDRVKENELSYFETVANIIHHVYLHYDRYKKDAWEEAFESPSRMAYSLLKTIAFLTTSEN